MDMNKVGIQPNISHKNAWALYFVFILLKYEPSHKKTNIMDSASSINLDQPKHAADTLFAYSGFSVSSITTLYIYPPEMECVSPD